MKMGASMTIFFLFFGIALIEAVQNKNWLLALFFAALYPVFLHYDNIGNKKNHEKKDN